MTGMTGADRPDEEQGKEHQAEDDHDDLRDLSRELTTSDISAVVAHHELHPNQPLDTSDIVGDNTRTLVAHGLVTFGRDPAVSDWLGRPRSLAARLIAFVLGCALMVGLDLWFGAPGVIIAGYLLLPFASLGAGFVLAAGFYRVVSRTRPPKWGANGLTVFNYFMTGLTLTFPTVLTVTKSWGAYYGLAITGPILLLVFIALATPLYYLVIKDSEDGHEAG
jgi:hypothetical protein